MKAKPLAVGAVEAHYWSVNFKARSKDECARSAQVHAWVVHSDGSTLPLIVTESGPRVLKAKEIGSFSLRSAEFMRDLRMKMALGGDS